MTVRPPGTIKLITILEVSPETVGIAFGTLNASNQSRNVQKIFFSSFFHVPVRYLLRFIGIRSFFGI
ncbi:MAG: hypothetical protein JRI88_05475 [Deltaproteobacteria bacterium]|nr:hypothetical protein [Deltaproteobacteria bacterium]